MALIMKNKVDIYLTHPERFQLDLLHQKGIWMANVVRPLGNHYEASKSQVDSVVRIANQRRREHNIRLQRIQMYIGIVTSVLYFAVDLIAAGAMSRVTLLSRYRSTRSFDDILVASSSLESAIKTFNSQRPSIADSIVANFDNKIRGLASTSTVRSVGTTVSSLANSVTQNVPADNMVLSGPLTFQNQLESFYSDVCRKINEQFIFLVRDSTAPESEKRAIIELFVHLPFVMPPTLSLRSFRMHIPDYFELCYWVQLVTSTSYSASNNLDDHLSYAINDRILALTGHQFTNTGGTMVASSVRRSDGGMAFSRNHSMPSQYMWRGWCSGDQARYGGIIIAEAKRRLLTPFFISQGISCQNTYG